MKKEYDAILIPGGGLTKNGQLPDWTKKRIEVAFDQANGNPFFITLSGGTVHKAPPIDEEGFPIYESQTAGNFLIELGVNPDQILSEISSFDTIGNAYFARVIHTDPMGLRKLLIVTSEFHLPRAQAAFEWIFNLLPDENYDLDFIASPNTGLDPEILSARIEKEASSLASLKQNAQGISTLADFHTWLFLEHAAYAPGEKARKNSNRLSGKLLSSY